MINRGELRADVGTGAGRPGLRRWYAGNTMSLAVTVMAVPS
jgi:hypothetical protein